MTIIISDVLTETYDLRPNIIWVKNLDGLKLFEKEHPEEFKNIIMDKNTNVL